MMNVHTLPSQWALMQRCKYLKPSLDCSHALPWWWDCWDRPLNSPTNQEGGCRWQKVFSISSSTGTRIFRNLHTTEILKENAHCFCLWLWDFHVERFIYFQTSLNKERALCDLNTVILILISLVKTFDSLWCAAVLSSGCLTLTSSSLSQFDSRTRLMSQCFVLLNPWVTGGDRRQVVLKRNQVFGVNFWDSDRLRGCLSPAPALHSSGDVTKG